MKYALLLLVLLALFCSCNPRPDTGNFDAESWKKDRHGCSGIRKSLTTELLQLKETLMDVTENQLRAILGMPDAINLHERGQKFLIYYIDGHEKCGDDNAANDVPLKLMIRISSIHTVKAITLEQ